MTKLSFGELCRKKRKQLKRSRAMMAKYGGLQMSMMASVEMDQALPQGKTIKAFMNAYDIPPSEAISALLEGYRREVCRKIGVAVYGEG